MSDVSLAAGVGFAVYAGILTFFSPCAYALLPGYVGFYVRRTDGEATLAGSVGRGLAAGAGVLLTLGLFLGATFVVGQLAADALRVVEPVVGVALIVLGLLIVLDRAPTLSIRLPERRTGVLGFGIFGAGYAAASAGCVAPILLAVGGLGLSLSGTGGLVVVGAYVATVSALMIAVTVAAGTGLSAGSGWVSANRDRLERAAGVVIVLAGVGQLYVAYAVEYTL
ncbi:cytochrome c biogenesis protein CcdA [Halovivax gelatinilyticus]|uniref:cytochrome c biogenesis protein CcdA n=1 Tax=Halovivax gelatinilyticus TaxID=2961597 RepID=UPI0020CA6DD5|nr:cytochrome c biogenesis protein CcdA [Halovivax gelatinilyticus]